MLSDIVGNNTNICSVHLDRSSVSRAFGQCVRTADEKIEKRGGKVLNCFFFKDFVLEGKSKPFHFFYV